MIGIDFMQILESYIFSDDQFLLMPIAIFFMIIPTIFKVMSNRKLYLFLFNSKFTFQGPKFAHFLLPGILLNCYLMVITFANLINTLRVLGNAYRNFYNLLPILFQIDTLFPLIVHTNLFLHLLSYYDSILLKCDVPVCDYTMKYSEIMGVEVEKHKNENISDPLDELTPKKVQNLSAESDTKLCEASLNEPGVTEFK